ncbi:BON domain-containing protein [Caenimonas terrae]|uniref:BON domain-containing protein n=1 Tax=Caenimonas terrae TaxID=696074 RepID=A0ABW0NDA6_9BURK
MTSKLPSPILAIALAAALAGTLSACVPLVVGGAAMSAMVAADRRTSGTQLEDETIELRGASRLRDAFGDRAHINVTSYNRQVLLTGEVPSDAAKQQAEQLISRVENVRLIVNELVVAGTSTLVQRSNDTLITGKVKASLVDAKDLYAGAFKVVTERGTVFLMGRVTPPEADRATAIARQINGVQRVVRIFELISEEEMRRIQTQLAPTSPTSAKP